MVCRDGLASRPYRTVVTNGRFVGTASELPLQIRFVGAAGLSRCYKSISKNSHIHVKKIDFFIIGGIFLIHAKKIGKSQHFSRKNRTLRSCEDSNLRPSSTTTPHTHFCLYWILVPHILS
jgi:hypothetical protein